MTASYSIYPKEFLNNVGHITSNTCFVIMPFTNELNNTYFTLQTVAGKLGIKCVRADDISTTSEPMLNKICTQISQAHYIIVDITGLNPNVFYELGIAHVLRDAKKVLIIKEQGTKCPSDIQHIHYYQYSKNDLSLLSTKVEEFFVQNTILEDLKEILNFHDLLPRDSATTKEFITRLTADSMGHTDCLIRILNRQTDNLTQGEIYALLEQLTTSLNKMSVTNELYLLYTRLILLVLSKAADTFNMSWYISDVFGGKYSHLPSEWYADCGIAVLDDLRYFTPISQWIFDYLKGVSPAEFDMAKYKIEIGLIKSKSKKIDESLVEQLGSDNKTLGEHCAKVIKERKTEMAIPKLVELIKTDENPYLVRSCIDALVSFAQNDILIDIRSALNERGAFVDQYPFIKKHLGDLDRRINELQNRSDS